MRTRGVRITGRLQVASRGYGFVVPDGDGEQDVFIPTRAIHGAMHGDHVQAEVLVWRGRRREGRITGILKRAHTTVVGRVEARAQAAGQRGSALGGWVMSPSDPRVGQWLTLRDTGGVQVRAGDIAVAKITRYATGTDSKPAEGRLVRVLGRAEDPATDSLSVLEAFTLPRGFPPAVEAEAAQLPTTVTKAMRQGRRDLRALPTITIDGETARDYDDAVSVAPDEHGRIRLWVHIADVSHYVASGSALDQEALLRSTSVYFPDLVVPMFPETLSNGICSLNPGQDRLAVTVEMVCEQGGRCVESIIYRSVIKSQERMTYRQVASLLGTRDPELRRRFQRLLPSLTLMESLARGLARRRQARGSLDLDLPEPELVLDRQGRTVDIIKSERTIAHRIIEEFMLCANEAVAQRLTHQGWPFLHRVHDPPDPDKVAEFQEVARAFGLHFPREGGHKAFQALLREVEGRPESRVVSYLLLRTMKQARYSAEQGSHFGLATTLYAHFTSPIRRYPDLVVHRLIIAACHGDRSQVASARQSLASLTRRLPEIARHTTEQERRAIDAERQILALKKARFLAGKLGEECAGVITGVTSYGLFVELDNWLVEGLVPLATLNDDDYWYDKPRGALVGRRTRRRWRVGLPVTARVERVEPERRQITLGLVTRPPLALGPGPPRTRHP